MMGVKLEFCDLLVEKSSIQIASFVNLEVCDFLRLGILIQHTSYGSFWGVCVADKSMTQLIVPAILFF